MCNISKDIFLKLIDITKGKKKQKRLKAYCYCVNANKLEGTTCFSARARGSAGCYYLALSSITLLIDDEIVASIIKLV
jgi:hypothetical protein